MENAVAVCDAVETRQRCARRAAGLNSHWQCQFTRAARRPQRPALPRRHLWVHTLSSPQRLVCDQAPPRDPSRETRQRCAYRVAPWRRRSDCVPPSSLGRAWIPPEPPISKSTPKTSKGKCPVVTFPFSRAIHGLAVAFESRVTEGRSEHAFACSPRICHRSYSTRPS